MGEFKDFLNEQRNLEQEILSQKHNPNPTEKQKETGNYAKPTLRINGLIIKIENPIGTYRSGVDCDGVSWEHEFKNASYGEIRGTRASDCDGVDVFVAPKEYQRGLVWVVNQSNDIGVFDEVKCMIGFKDEQHAIDTYIMNYADGWAKNHILSIKEVSLKDFKEWLNFGDTTKQFVGGVDIYNK